MRMIGVGFGRSGTMSLKAALEELTGEPSFHMIELITGENRERDLPYWSKIADREPVDWHEVFDGWGSTVDWPACSRWEELVEAFPGVPVLLNFRDFDGFYKSFENTIVAVRKAAQAGELPAGRQPRGPLARAVARDREAHLQG